MIKIDLSTMEELGERAMEYAPHVKVWSEMAVRVLCQAERDDMREQAAKVADKYELLATKILAQEIRDLK